MKLTNSEQQVKEHLEHEGFNVLKGSYPDFIAYNEFTKEFKLVEAKKKVGQNLSKSQKQTMKTLQELGLKCQIIHAETMTITTEKIIEKLPKRKLTMNTPMPLEGRLLRLERFVAFATLVFEEHKRRKMEIIQYDI